MFARRDAYVMTEEEIAEYEKTEKRRTGTEEEEETAARPVVLPAIWRLSISTRRHLINGQRNKLDRTLGVKALVLRAFECRG